MIYIFLMINIITSFYIPTNDKEREKELKTALHNNLINRLIKKIHLFLDKETDEEYIKSLPEDFIKKIYIIRIGSQPLYSDLFSYANTLKGEFCMICNGDIWIAGIPDLRITMDLLEAKYIFSLTRHEKNGSLELINRSIDSYDAFVFKSPINVYIETMVQHKQNIWGAENCVIDALVSLKYTNIINPCLQFKIIHEHDMGRQNRIEANRHRMQHKGNSIKPCLICKENNRVIIRKYIQPMFKLF